MQYNLFTTCDHCGKDVPTVDTIVKTVHIGRVTKTYHLCSQQCVIDQLLAKIRKEGW